jgi:outer membrane protein TolC
MGGAIIAANKIADIGEKIANDNFALQQQSNIYSIDQTYWTVVSLKQKQKLALCYRDLVSKLDSDVYKMVRAGVATHADKLKVDVKVNEADMDITEVNNGLSLSKMLLCQLCGMKLDDKFTLADEENETLDGKMEITDYTPDSTFSSRPEIRMLQNAIEISKQNVIIARAAYMPHVALTGGYLISNPNVWNGFQRKFSGVWNVGITVQMSVWNWFEGTYNVRASKAASQIAQMQLDDTREKIELQITQSRYKVNEAQKRLLMANQDMKSAEENLRCANIGFKEGVIDITNVMAAQTAWQRAKSQQIDAEVEVKLTQVGLNKALGILQ